jgi:hypothetical protein
MSMQSITTALDDEAGKLAARRALLESVNEVLPALISDAVSDLRGSDSGIVMALDGSQLSLAQALKLLPAEKSYAAISGQFENPQELDIVTESEMRESCRYPLFWPVFPVKKVASAVLGPYFVWQTRLLNSPVRVELYTADATDWEHLMAEGRFVTNGSYSVILQPLVEPDVKPLATAQQAWNAKWDEFFMAQDYSASQLSFARAFKAAAVHRTVVTAADLPRPAPSTMTVAGQDLVILQTGTSPEEWPAKSSMRALARVGSFWGRFTQEQADRLLQFQQDMTASAPGPDSEYHEIMVVLEKAKLALEQFNRESWGEYRGKPPASLLSNYLQAEFGYPISVSYRDQVRAFGSKYSQEVWISLQACNLGAVVNHKGIYEKGDKLWFEHPAACLKPVSFVL